MSTRITSLILLRPFIRWIPRYATRTEPSRVVCFNSKVQPRPFSSTPVTYKESNENACSDGQSGTIDITYAELLQHLNNPSSIVIDVRNPEELVESGVMPNTINIPLPVLLETLDMPDEQFKYLFGVSKPTREQDIIFSCKKGIRSKNAIMLTLGKGFRRVRHFPGGWLEWEEKQSK